MNFRNNKSVNKAGALTVKGVPYTLVRAEMFYYLKVIDYNKDLFKTASTLTSKPTVVFYTENSQDKVILDYSLANETDKEYLESFFANMNQLNSFAVTNGSYIDKSELEANIGCSLAFDGYKEHKIFARVNSVVNQNTAIDVYDGNYFIGTPQLTKSDSLSNLAVPKQTALVSVNPNTKTTLETLGLIEGDIIEIINSDSLNNKTKFEIVKISTINDKEVFNIAPIYSDQTAKTESLVGQASLINVYVRGSTNREITLNGDLGCCSDPKQTVSFENQTKDQCYVRSPSYIHTKGACPQTTNGLVQAEMAYSALAGVNTTEQEPVRVYLTITYNSNVNQSNTNFNIGVRRTVPSITSLSPFNSVTTIIGSVTVLSENGLPNTTGVIELKIGRKYYIIQQDSSNQGISFKITSQNALFDADTNGLNVTYHNTQTNVGNVITLDVPLDFSYDTLYLTPIPIGLGNNISPVLLQIVD
jgi:hypothetical protein